MSKMDEFKEKAAEFAGKAKVLAEDVGDRVSDAAKSAKDRAEARIDDSKVQARKAEHNDPHDDSTVTEKVEDTVKNVGDTVSAKVNDAKADLRDAKHESQ